MAVSPLSHEFIQGAIMAHVQATTRRVYRRTDDYTPNKSRVKLVTEDLPLPLAATSVLIKVHAVSLNYRDANIANGGNPWPVTPHGIPCNDAAGEVIAVGEGVRTLQVGDRVAPIIDTENLTGRESKRSWLAADEDGVLADYLVFSEEKLTRLPKHLDWVQACLIPCAGVTAWTSLLGIGIGKSVLVQGTSTYIGKACSRRSPLTSCGNRHRRRCHDRTKTCSNGRTQGDSKGLLCKPLLSAFERFCRPWGAFSGVSLCNVSAFATEELCGSDRSLLDSFIAPSMIS